MTSSKSLSNSKPRRSSSGPSLTYMSRLSKARALLLWQEITTQCNATPSVAKNEVGSSSSSFIHSSSSSVATIRCRRARGSPSPMPSSSRLRRRGGGGCGGAALALVGEVVQQPPYEVGTVPDHRSFPCHAACPYLCPCLLTCCLACLQVLVIWLLPWPWRPQLLRQE